MDQSEAESSYLFNSTFPTFMCNIETKYYKNRIGLVSCAGELKDIPSKILTSAEAIITYFQPKNKFFLQILAQLNNLANDNNIGLGILLTTKFSKDSTEISLEELQENSHSVFDIISLQNNQNDSNEKKYAFVANELKNHIWSNIQFPESNSLKKIKVNNSSPIEDDLEIYENLLTSMQHLQRNKYLSRDEFFDETEKLAEVLSTIIDEDDCDSD